MSAATRPGALPISGALLINGIVGAGKTTTADAVAALERERGTPHAVIDLDAIRRLWPSPPGDPFQHELELTGLSALAAGYRAAGAVHLILAGVVEEAAERPRYVEALGGLDLFVCRLHVDAVEAETRLRRRHADEPDVRDWHLARAVELAGILDRARLDDAVVTTTGRPVAAVAAEVHRLVGW